jgi:hypothetical protein
MSISSPSSQITKEVQEFAKSEIEKEYAEMEDIQMSQRTVQKYLRAFEKEGIVYDTGHYE